MCVAKSKIVASNKNRCHDSPVDVVKATARGRDCFSQDKTHPFLAYVHVLAKSTVSKFCSETFFCDRQCIYQLLQGHSFGSRKTPLLPLLPLPACILTVSRDHSPLLVFCVIILVCVGESLTKRNKISSREGTKSSSSCAKVVVFRCGPWLFIVCCLLTWPASGSWFWKGTLIYRSSPCQIRSIKGIRKSRDFCSETCTTQEPTCSLCYGGEAAHLPALIFHFATPFPLMSLSQVLSVSV